MYHRENQELEYKQQFNFAGLAEYFRDFAAFANNKGGFLIFGVKDSPRVPVGLSDNAKNQFEKIDPEKITGYLLNIFSAEISWDQCVVSKDGMDFGVFEIEESENKPIIAKTNEGRENIIKSSEIYYRYGGRTQKIEYAELKRILELNIDRNNKNWRELISKISRFGPQNVALLDTKSGLLSHGNSGIFLIDEDLIEKLNSGGDMEDQKQGLPKYILKRDLYPVKTIEKQVEIDKLEMYPYSATELAKKVKEINSTIGRNTVWRFIKQNDLKNNPEYSTYVFRNKKQEDEYRLKNVVPNGTVSIYNDKALKYIINNLS
jgi:hypothetical protein